MKKLIAIFDGGYSRVGNIHSAKGRCDVCDKDKPIIKIDGCEGEYIPGNICLECARTALKEQV